jgi:hypothetical protein
MAEKEKSVEDYRREYEALAKKAGSFDLETKQLLKKREADHKAWLVERKAARESLLSQKLAATKALQDAELAPPKPVVRPAKPK